MSGKVFTVRPTVNYSYQVKKDRETEKVSLKDKIFEWGENLLLTVLAVVFLVLSVAVAYETLVYFKIKFEKRALGLEKVQLEKELNRLTSREVILEKAKTLGLRAPQEQDYIRLR
ncbi:MAG: hypothetical protein RMI93_06330 [Caldimicrobium sp.]|nr:hypothetical protein [Caldimicrobium sp.]MDW8183204.1 hypothetical protein [Caldimicrobium sp.]